MMVDDLTPPVLVVDSSRVAEGADVLVTVDEDATAYMVIAGTEGTKDAIIAASVGDVAATAATEAAISTTGVALGNYELYAIDAFDNISKKVAVEIVFVDVVAPVLSDVTASVDTKTETEISATSDEDATLYLVPEGTTADKASIVAAQVVEAAATAATPVVMDISAVALGNYDLYAIDASDNISAASVVVIMSTVGVSDSYSKMFGVYPNPVGDVIYIRNSENIQKLEIANILGQNIKVINMVNNSHSVSDLESGIYFLRMHVDGEIITQRIVKK